nr:BLUF domain-containing protein [Leptospiraceae bacterium]
KISGDPRHINVEIVSEGETEQRMFSRWSMGFWDMENENIKNLNRSPSQKKMTLWELANDPLMSLAFFEAISRTDL